MIGRRTRWVVAAVGVSLALTAGGAGSSCSAPSDERSEDLETVCEDGKIAALDDGVVICENEDGEQDVEIIDEGA